MLLFNIHNNNNNKPLNIKAIRDRLLLKLQGHLHQRVETIKKKIKYVHYLMQKLAKHAKNISTHTKKQNQKYFSSKIQWCGLDRFF